MTNEELVEQIQQGINTADFLERLYKSNISLIKQLVRKYEGYESMEDLLQVAYLGIYEAVQKYESSRNMKFMTFAKWYIWKACRDYLINCGCVNFKLARKTLEYRKAVARFQYQYGYKPTAGELAKFMGVSARQIQEFRRYSQKVISLDSTILKDAEETLLDTLEADYCLENDVVDKIFEYQCEDELWKFVESHSTQEQNSVLQRYFRQGQTLKAIADEDKKSIERIRQVKNDGLRQLRKMRSQIAARFEVLEARAYNGNLNRFKRCGSSIVEYIAIKEEDIMKGCRK